MKEKKEMRRREGRSVRENRWREFHLEAKRGKKVGVGLDQCED